MRSRMPFVALAASVALLAGLFWFDRGTAAPGRAAKDARDARAPSPAVPDAPAGAPVPEPSAPAGTAAAPEAPHEPSPPGTVTGTVRLEGDGPLDDVVVVVTREGDPGERREVRPDADGNVWLDRLDPGRYELRATHPGYAPRVFSFDVSESGGAGPFEIVLAEGGTVRARVVDGRSAPVEKRRVALRLLDRGEPVVALTDAKGEAVFERLPAGYYWIHCGEANSGPRCDANVLPGRTTEVLFELSCGVLGTAYDAAGNPLASVSVRLQPVDRSEAVHHFCLAETDDAGRFEILGARPGEYRPRVAVFGAGGYFAAFDPIVIVKGEMKRADLRLPPREIRGRVTRDTGEPWTGVPVTVQAFDAEVPEDGAIARRGYYAGWLTVDGWSAEHLARPDAQGRFALVGLSPGAYEVWVMAADRPICWERRIVRVAEHDVEHADFAMALGPVGKMRVRAAERDGTPATGVLFSELVTDDVQMALEPRQVGDGLFELDLRAGSRRIYVYRIGAWSELLHVEVREDETIEKLVKADR